MILITRQSATQVTLTYFQVVLTPSLDQAHGYLPSQCITMQVRIAQCQLYWLIIET